MKKNPKLGRQILIESIFDFNNPVTYNNPQKKLKFIAILNFIRKIHFQKKVT